VREVQRCARGKRAGDSKFDGVALKLLVNQSRVTSFRDVLAPAWKKKTGGTLAVTAAPYDQLTSKQILGCRSSTGEFDVFDYFYFGLGDLIMADTRVATATSLRGVGMKVLKAFCSSVVVTAG
jgi:hypothetical protein